MELVTVDQVKPGMTIRYQVGDESRHAKVTAVHPVWKDEEPGFDALLLDPATHEVVKATDHHGNPTRTDAICWGRLAQITHLDAEPEPQSN